MNDFLIRALIRSRMALTTQEHASGQIRRCLLNYRGVYSSVGVDEARSPVTVPPMLGVDEDMRSWSLFMILEHNVIVNRTITAIVKGLALEETPDTGGVIDPKRDVMPSPDPGPEQIDLFRESVERHLEVVSSLPKLRGTLTKRHPVFGLLDAHGWHCMFGLHLEIHLRQADEVVRVMSRR